MATADTVAENLVGRTMEELAQEQLGKLIMGFPYQEEEVIILEIFGQPVYFVIAKKVT